MFSSVRASKKKTKKHSSRLDSTRLSLLHFPVRFPYLLFFSLLTQSLAAYPFLNESKRSNRQRLESEPVNFKDRAKANYKLEAQSFAAFDERSPPEKIPRNRKGDPTTSPT